MEIFVVLVWNFIYVCEFVKMGVDVVILFFVVLRSLINYFFIDKGFEVFLKDWEKIG